MIPYLLAAVGGYLIGQSQKKDVPQMAKGGGVDGTLEIKEYISQNYPDKDLNDEEFISLLYSVFSTKIERLGLSRNDLKAMLKDKGGIMAKGGKVKSKKWIQDALSGGNNKGALRRTAKRKGLLRGDENLSMTDLKKLEKMGGTTAKRAYMAETLRKFD